MITPTSGQTPSKGSAATSSTTSKAFNIFLLTIEAIASCILVTIVGAASPTAASSLSDKLSKRMITNNERRTMQPNSMTAEIFKSL